MDPRDLEASLLLKAAAKLQAVLEAWDQKPPSALADALLYNRRLWIVFIDAVMRDENRLLAFQEGAHPCIRLLERRNV
jgi:flagellar biosynthesis activator protein FlaF